MGGPFRLVHVATLNGVSLAWFLVVGARGAGFPSYQGCPPHRLPSRLGVASFNRLSASPLLSFLWSRFLVVLPGGWLCATHRCRPAFLDSLCARYARVRILCARLGRLVCVLSPRRVCVIERVNDMASRGERGRVGTREIRKQGGAVICRS